MPEGSVKRVCCSRFMFRQPKKLGLSLHAPFYSPLYGASCEPQLRKKLTSSWVCFDSHCHRCRGLYLRNMPSPGAAVPSTRSNGTMSASSVVPLTQNASGQSVTTGTRGRQQLTDGLGPYGAFSGKFSEFWTALAYKLWRTSCLISLGSTHPW